MSHFKFDNPIGIYSTELKPLQQSDRARGSEVVFPKSMLPTAKEVYRDVRSAPGQNGIANLSKALSDTKFRGSYQSLMSELVKDSDDTWYTEVQGDLWYVYESFGKNTMRNYSRKLFSVVFMVRLGQNGRFIS